MRIRVVDDKKCGISAISNLPARSSAEIRALDVQKLRTLYDFCDARASVCGDGYNTADVSRILICARDPLRRSAMFKNLRLFLRFLRSTRDPLRGSCVSKRSRCGPVRSWLSLGEPSACVSTRSCAFLAHDMAFGSCLVVCAPARKSQLLRRK